MTRQEAAERLLDYADQSQDCIYSDQYEGHVYEDDVRTLFTPPLPSEVQEALGLAKEAAMYASTYGQGKWTDAEIDELFATIRAALSTASETGAAFIELMEAVIRSSHNLHRLGALGASEIERVLDAHKARYDALRGDA